VFHGIGVNRAFLLGFNVGIPFGGFCISVTHQFLKDADIGANFQHGGGTTVPECIAGHAFINVGALCGRQIVITQYLKHLIHEFEFWIGVKFWLIFHMFGYNITIRVKVERVVYCHCYGGKSYIIVAVSLKNRDHYQSMLLHNI
jgi:hypothetical protein